MLHNYRLASLQRFLNRNQSAMRVHHLRECRFRKFLPVRPFARNANPDRQQYPLAPSLRLSCSQWCCAHGLPFFRLIRFIGC